MSSTRWSTHLGFAGSTSHALRYVGETLDAAAGLNDRIAMLQRGRKTAEMRRHDTRPVLGDLHAAVLEAGKLLGLPQVAGTLVGTRQADEELETAWIVLTRE